MYLLLGFGFKLWFRGLGRDMQRSLQIHLKETRRPETGREVITGAII